MNKQENPTQDLTSRRSFAENEMVKMGPFTF